jgi:hypothetical protein
VDPSHHSKTDYQVSDGRKAFNMEGDCGYIEKAVAESQEGMILQLAVLATCLQILTVKAYHVTKLFTRPRVTGFYRGCNEPPES